MKKKKMESHLVRYYYICQEWSASFLAYKEILLQAFGGGEIKKKGIVTKWFLMKNLQVQKNGCGKELRNNKNKKLMWLQIYNPIWRERLLQILQIELIKFTPEHTNHSLPFFLTRKVTVILDPFKRNTLPP